MVKAIASVALCLSSALSAQPTPTLRFEIASIKPSGTGSDSSSGIATGHGHLDAHNVTLKRCVIGAYRVGPQQIFGGPDWMDSDRFQILAKTDASVNEDGQLMLMLQTLLADRFNLKLHKETRTMSALVLEVAKGGPRLLKSESGETSINTSGMNAATVIDARNTDMDAFARVLASQTDLPVVNQTGLAGIFNIKLSWTRETAKLADAGAPEEASLFTAIQEQLGLRLRSQKAPVEVLVIDSAEKPSEN